MKTKRIPGPLTVQELSKLGLRCPMCGGKKFRACYHDHQILDSFVCEKGGCGIRWQEDSPKSDMEKDPKAWVENVNYYRGHKPRKDGLYKGINAGGFVWVLHKVGSYLPITDYRSADETEFRDMKEGAVQCLIEKV